MALVEARGAAGWASKRSGEAEAEVAVFGGKGKSDFFLLRRGSLKRVVVVEMVCVVVVVAYVT